MLETRSCRKAPEFKQEKPRKWRKKTCKKQKLASSTTHWLFLLVNSSHSFSCFSASLQVQQFLLMLKKSKKTHQKKRNRKQQTNSAIAAQAFLLPPTTLFAPFATGLLSYLVPYSIYYPPTNLFTTCLSHYLPITLPNTLLFFFYYLPTYFLLSLILMMMSQGFFFFVNFVMMMMYISEVAIIHTTI